MFDLLCLNLHFHLFQQVIKQIWGSDLILKFLHWLLLNRFQLISNAWANLNQQMIKLIHLQYCLLHLVAALKAPLNVTQFLHVSHLFLNLKQSLQYHFNDEFSFVLHLGLQQAKILQNHCHHHSLTKLLVPILLKISGLLITSFTLRVLQHLNHQFLVILIPNLIFFLLQTSHFLSLVCLEKFVIYDFKK